jgi:hypothetical protein
MISGSGPEIGGLVLISATFFRIYLCLVNHEGICYLFNQSRLNSNSGGKGGNGGGNSGCAAGDGTSGGGRWTNASARSQADNLGYALTRTRRSTLTGSWRFGTAALGSRRIRTGTRVLGNGR